MITKKVKTQVVTAGMFASLMSPAHMQAEQVQQTRESIRHIQGLTFNNAQHPQVLEAVQQLTSHISMLNSFLAVAQFTVEEPQLTLSKLTQTEKELSKMMVILREYAKSHGVFAQYTPALREYAVSINNLSLAISYIRQNHGLFNVVSLGDLDFTQEELDRLHQQAKEKDEKWLQSLA